MGNSGGNIQKNTRTQIKKISYNHFEKGHTNLVCLFLSQKPKSKKLFLFKRNIMDKKAFLLLANAKLHGQAKPFKIEYWKDNGDKVVVEKAVFTKSLTKNPKVGHEEFSKMLKIKDLVNNTFHTIHPWCIVSVNNIQYIGL